MESTSINRTYSRQTLDDSAWDRFVYSHPAAHILQTSGWGTLKANFGWQAERVALADGNGATKAGALLLFRTIGWRGKGLTLGYVPRGPLLNWCDRSEVMALLDELNNACRRQGAALLKVEPDLADTLEHRQLLSSYGFQPSRQTVQPPSTITIDISGEEEAILARMKQKWRYNIRLAEKKGITVRQATAADLPIFNQLMATTGSRDGFAVHSPAYYNLAYQLFVPHQAAFLLAEYAGEAIAAIVVTCVGKTGIYLWGASADKERNRMPNHALQWAGVRWAKAQGATSYDFWGIPDEIGQLALGLRNGNGSGTPVEQVSIDLENLPSYGLWGVYRFKQGFNGNVVRAVGSWDRPVNPLGYAVYAGSLWAREKWQEAKKRQGDADPTSDVTRWQGEPVLARQAKLDPWRADANTQVTLSPCHLVTSASQWRSILSTLPNPHVLQSWEWGAVKGQTEWHAERYVLNEANDSPLAAFQLLWRQPIPYLPLRIAYVPKGPVVDWQDERKVKAALSWIVIEARQRGCLFVKIDPDVREDSPEGKRLLTTLRSNGWRYSDDQIQFKNTGYSDLTTGETALLDGMKQKWRYNVRLAEKRGIRVREGGPGDLHIFYDLYAETGQRDGFLIRPYDYYRTTWQTFLSAQAEVGNPAGGALLLAEHAEEPTAVAGIFLFRYGRRVWYFYGASSERRRRDMPNYLLQWEALRWAINQGCTIYDWWGAPTEIENAEDGMQGVWQFKQGFGAEFQPHVGAWDYPVWPLLYDGYTRLIPLVLQWMRSR
ncbi:MAG: peptidoglycan bridge formation glycyltransferase FemA/FemB family protein [Caldilineaceae bacterium]